LQKSLVAIVVPRNYRFINKKNKTNRSLLRSIPPCYRNRLINCVRSVSWDKEIIMMTYRLTAVHLPTYQSYQYVTSNDWRTTELTVRREILHNYRSRIVLYYTCRNTNKKLRRIYETPHRLLSRFRIYRCYYYVISTSLERNLNQWIWRWKFCKEIAMYLSFPLTELPQTGTK